MRIPFFSWVFSWVSFVALSACGVTADPPIVNGVHGDALTNTLQVTVRGESDGRSIAGASVDVGGAAVTTDALGEATLTTTASPVTLTVRAAGFVTEHWIGVDRQHASVALATPLPSRALTASMSGGTADAVVSAATSLSILRTSSTLGSTSACAGGACVVMLSVATRSRDLDLVIVDAASVRLASHVAVDASDHVAVDLASIPVGERLVTLDVTIPSAPGLEAVVGVPGLVTDHGVALLPSSATATTSLLAPARVGSMAANRLWYVASARSADGSGESMIFDRDVGHDGAVHLPSAFLAIPSATASGSVGIDVDPEVELYVIEAFAGEGGERTLVLHPSGTHIDVPISLSSASSVVVRAVDTSRAGTDVDLAAAEHDATRMATLQL